MKKSLVALAAFAATAAFAQSSVTLYGIADAYVGQTKALGTLAAPSPSSQTVVNSGGLSTSRLGVSVKEDLGSGMQGFVVLENAVAIDGQKAAPGTSSLRKSVLGLTGSFGTVGLGAQQNPYSQVMENVLDAQSDSVFSAVAGSQGREDFAVTTNSVRYDTPNFDGFTAGVQIGLGENKTPALRAGRNTSFNVQYANGPLAVALANQMVEKGTLTTTFAPAAVLTVANRLTETALAGSYDFGAAKLNLGLTNSKLKAVTGTDKGINVGVTAPIGAFTVVGQLSRNKANGNLGLAIGSKNRTSFGLEGRYALSKRTTSYVGLNQTKNNNNTAPVNDNSRVVAVGVRHVF